jgi:hypothetical protein
MIGVISCGCQRRGYGRTLPGEACHRSRPSGPGWLISRRRRIHPATCPRRRPATGAHERGRCPTGRWALQHLTEPVVGQDATWPSHRVPVNVAGGCRAGRAGSRLTPARSGGRRGIRAGRADSVGSGRWPRCDARCVAARVHSRSRSGWESTGSMSAVLAGAHPRPAGLNGESPVMSRVCAPRGNRTPHPLICLNAVEQC